MESKIDEATVLKNDNRWLQNHTNRFFAFKVVGSIKKSRIQPNHLTLVSLFFGIAAVCLLLQDVFWSRIISSILLFFSLVFDSADGQLARLRKNATCFGYWFDKIIDRIKENMVVLALVWIAYQRTLRIEIWFLGILAVFLIGFMYYNLEILEKIFGSRPVAFSNLPSFLRNILNFGYGERIIYLSVLIAVNALVYALWLIVIGCALHLLANIHAGFKKGGA